MLLPAPAASLLRSKTTAGGKQEGWDALEDFTRLEDTLENMDIAHFLLTPQDIEQQGHEIDRIAKAAQRYFIKTSSVR